MLVITIAAYCTAYYIVNVVQLHMAIKRAWKLDPAKRIKPIDCVQCLSVWMAVALFFLPVEIAQFMAVCFGAGWIGAKVH
jgi:hypothetical protein